MYKFYILLFACLISACSTYGQPVTQAQLAQIKKGETTQADLLSEFGKPVSVTRNLDGSQVMTWAYVHVGLAGYNYKNQSFAVTLDPQGKVTNYTQTDAGYR